MFKQFPSRENKFVALKVVKSAAHYTETALDEIKLLKCVSNKLKIANSQIFSFLPLNYVVTPRISVINIINGLNYFETIS